MSTPVDDQPSDRDSSFSPPEFVDDLNPKIPRMEEKSPHPIYSDSPASPNAMKSTASGTGTTSPQRPLFRSLFSRPQSPFGGYVRPPTLHTIPEHLPTVNPPPRPTGTKPKSTINQSSFQQYQQQQQQQSASREHDQRLYDELQTGLENVQLKRQLSMMEIRLEEALKKLSLQDTRQHDAPRHQHLGAQANPTSHASSDPYIQHVIDPFLQAATPEQVQQVLYSLSQTDTSEIPPMQNFVDALTSYIKGRTEQNATHAQRPLGSQQQTQQQPQRTYDAYAILDDLDYHQYFTQPPPSGNIDAAARQAKTTKAKISSATLRNPHLQDLQRQLSDLLDQVTWRSTLKAMPGTSDTIKTSLDRDISFLKAKMSHTSEEVKDITQIIDDRSKELPVPRDYPHSGADLYRIRKLLTGIKNTERILRLVAKEADTFRLSHEEVKELLALTLPDEPYKTFDANKDYPLAVIYKLLSDQFLDQTSPYAKVSDIDTFSFYHKETLRAGLVRLDTLISETNSLFPVDERVGRRARLKQEILFKAIPDKVRDKLELNKVRALRRGTFYQFEDMLDDAEDILTSMRLPLVPSKNATLSLKNVQVNNASAPKKRKTPGGRFVPTGQTSNNYGQRMRKTPRSSFQRSINKQGRPILTRRRTPNQPRRPSFQTSQRRPQPQARRPPTYSNNRGQPRSQGQYRGSYGSSYQPYQNSPSSQRNTNWSQGRNQPRNVQRFSARGDHVLHTWNARTKDHMVMTSDQPIPPRRYQNSNQGRNFNGNFNNNYSNNGRSFHANSMQVSDYQHHEPSHSHEQGN